MGGSRRWMRCSNAGILLGAAAFFFMGGLDCGGDGHIVDVPDAGNVSRNPADDVVDAADPLNASDDASDAADTVTQSACPPPAAPTDLCTALPSGSVSACTRDSAGQPSQKGYLEIVGSDGARRYVCATAWAPGGSGGYHFGHPDQFMTDPESCCGTNVMPAAAPTAPQPAVGYLGALHAPTGIKPQETIHLDGGLIRRNPFAMIVRDRDEAMAFSAALASWMAWARDGLPHAAPDGSGAYYFPGQVLINYAILEASDGLPVVVIGPEVSPAADFSAPLGHPSLGACAAGGGAPLVLIAGEISGTTLTNHSGRFGHDPSVTADALNHAAMLLNCLGISITTTKYYPAKP